MEVPLRAQKAARRREKQWEQIPLAEQARPGPGALARVQPLQSTKGVRARTEVLQLSATCANLLAKQALKWLAHFESHVRAHHWFGGENVRNKILSAGLRQQDHEHQGRRNSPSASRAVELLGREWSNRIADQNRPGDRKLRLRSDIP